jgi:hypothetical protein
MSEIFYTVKYSVSILFGHEEAGNERAWPRQKSGESRIVSKQNASPVHSCIWNGEAISVKER